jgi:hypothetical protein
MRRIGNFSFNYHEKFFINDYKHFYSNITLILYKNSILRTNIEYIIIISSDYTSVFSR